MISYQINDWMVYQIINYVRMIIDLFNADEIEKEYKFLENLGKCLPATRHTKPFQINCIDDLKNVLEKSVWNDLMLMLLYIKNYFDTDISFTNNTELMEVNMNLIIDVKMQIDSIEKKIKERRISELNEMKIYVVDELSKKVKSVSSDSTLVKGAIAGILDASIPNNSEFMFKLGTHIVDCDDISKLKIIHQILKNM